MEFLLLFNLLMCDLLLDSHQFLLHNFWVIFFFKSESIGKFFQ